MASLPGRTVWQKATELDALFLAPSAAVPSTQYSLLGKGFEMSPFSSQYSPPFYQPLAMIPSAPIAFNLPWTLGMCKRWPLDPTAPSADRLGRHMGSSCPVHRADRGSWPIQHSAHSASRRRGRRPLGRRIACLASRRPGRPGRPPLLGMHALFGCARDGAQ